jgi:hypothetical protein
MDPPTVSKEGLKTCPTSLYDVNVVPLGNFSTRKILIRRGILKGVLKMG